MLGFILAVLAFGGGCVITYALMDAPRKRAMLQSRRLQSLRNDLDIEAEEAEERDRRLAARERALVLATTNHDRRVAELTASAAALGARVISYAELTAENQLLKRNLRNTAAQIAYQDCAAEELRKSLVSMTQSLNRVGLDLFDEARGSAKKSLTPNNYPATKQRLQSVVGRLRTAGVGLPASTEQEAFAELHVQYERTVRAAVEREEQARLRDQMREDHRRQREAQEAIEQAERERALVAAALQRALADAAGQHAAQVDELKAKLAEAEEKARRAVSNAQLTKVGTVYVISNPGSFGWDVFKIGMTRRENHMERVIELGGASVPFPFDIHMAIACDDAPGLEAALHRKFHKKRVNKVNPRKEFFRVTVAEIAAAVRELHGDVQYTADAEALEFIQSQQMTDADLEEVEQAFAKAGAISQVGSRSGVEAED